MMLVWLGMGTQGTDAASDVKGYTLFFGERGFGNAKNWNDKNNYWC